MVAKARVSGIMVASTGIDGAHRQALIANSSSFVEGQGTGDCVSTRNMFQGTRVIIVTFNGASSQIFVSQNVGELGGDPANATLTGMTVGSFEDGSSFPFDGKISDIAAWDRVLTANEIASLNVYASVRYGIALQ